MELGPSGIQEKWTNQVNRQTRKFKAAWEPPLLVTSPLTLKVQEGGEVFLTCFVSCLGECLHTWLHAGRVLSVDEFLVKKCLPHPIFTWWKEGSMVQLGRGLSLQME